MLYLKHFDDSNGHFYIGLLLAKKIHTTMCMIIISKYLKFDNIV